MAAHALHGLHATLCGRSLLPHDSVLLLGARANLVSVSEVDLPQIRRARCRTGIATTTAPASASTAGEIAG